MRKVTLHNEVAAAYRKMLISTLDELTDCIDLVRNAEVGADIAMWRIEMVVDVARRSLEQIDRAIAEE